MKRITKKISFYTVLVLIICLTNCNEDADFQEKGITQITVVDEGTYQPVPNASVKFYKSIDDWAFEENLIKTVTTNAKGQIRLKDLSNGEYFLDVVKDDMSNWQYTWGIPIYSGNIIIEQIPISVNINYYISSAEGKDWKITKIYDEFDNDLSDDPGYSCMIGNVVHFEKAGYYTMDDGTNRCDNLPQLREASWWGYDQNLSLLINGKDVHDYFIDPFFDDHFILNDYSGEDLVKYRYERI